jgi:site-specific DNA recombinase
MTHQKKAVLYCRVSGKKQVKEGSGLDSQEYRCRQYAAAKGYDVEKTFPDDVTGGGDFMKRPGMVALLRYLEKRPDENYVVIFDDLKRYSRDVEFHLKLRRLMKERGATRECLNFNFEDTPEGKFTETISAAAGEYERETMGRQNWQKSIARLEQGYCVQAVPPVGYKYKLADSGGKVLVKNEPYASIVKEALEGYATGRFASQIEVARFLEAQPDFPRKREDRKIPQQAVVNLLGRHLYAGLLDGRAWGVSVREGQHEGLISIAVFERIQKKLDGGTYAPARKDIGIDFPLRGAVCCSECTTPLTAGWSKGKCKKYPYYFCRRKGCDLYGKAIARKKIEGDFEALLSALQPTKGLVEITAAMFRDFWNTQLDQAAAVGKAIKRDAADAENKIEKLLDAVVEATNPRVITAYEKRIEKLERQRLALHEKERELATPPGSFDDLFEHSIRFLSSPWKLWQTGRFEMQRLVLKLTFSGHLHYSRETGFRTPQTTIPFSFLGNFAMKEKMVPHT